MSLSSKEQRVLLYPCRGPKALLGTGGAETRVGSDVLPLKADLLLSLGQRAQPAVLAGVILLVCAPALGGKW